MNILVTGGAGYIGSHIVKLLGENTDYNITVIDNLSTGNKNAVLYGKLIQVDLNQVEVLNEIFAREYFDAVIHFAASIVVPESIENPLKYYINNTINTTNLINLCIKYNVPKFVFSSTAAVYGEPEVVPVSEISPTQPINPYGSSKLMVERVLQDTAKANYFFKYVILRYFNVAGADKQARIGQSFPGATHLIKVATEASLGKRSSISIYGDDFNTSDGTGVRDYIHVDDLADAHLRALEYLDHNDSNIFNCGYGKGYSVKEVIEAVKKVSKVNFKVDISDRRAGDPAIIIADNTKIRNLMKWLPKYDNLEYICETALNWERKLIKDFILV